LFIIISPLFSKAISFIIATLTKYWANKHWAFEKHEKEGIKEMAQFFIVTLIGLALDLLAFYYFIKIMGPQFQMPVKVWTELSIILAALAAALWNFLGYKFIVFKK
jgi:putative flippase GtrA